MKDCLFPGKIVAYRQGVFQSSVRQRGSMVYVCIGDLYHDLVRSEKYEQTVYYGVFHNGGMFCRL